MELSLPHFALIKLKKERKIKEREKYTKPEQNEFY